MTDPVKPQESRGEGDVHADSGVESLFPDEPFPCPACGQMLAASCRVCVACHQPIDPTRIQRPTPAVATVEPEMQAQPPLAPVRFPWRVFLIAVGVTWVAGVASLPLLGVAKSQLVFGLVQILTSGWVFYDANHKRVPKPFRWGFGSLLLWIIVFPWYLVRRRTPQAPCPFVEGEAGPVARALFFALIVFFLLGVLIKIFSESPT